MYRLRRLLCLASSFWAVCSSKSFAQTPTFTMVIPPGLSSCGVFQDGRTPELEHALKCRIGLREGRWELGTDAPTVPADLIQSLEFGPQGLPAVPRGPGVFRVAKLPPKDCAPGVSCYKFSFEQEWDAGGQPIKLQDYGGFYFRWVNGGPDPRELVIDEERLSQETFLHGMAGTDPNDFTMTLRFSSCGYPGLPLWKITLELEGGYRALLDERYRIPMAGSGPAQLVRGEVWLGEAHRTQESYWNLVYAAEHHNWNEQYWVLFDEPVKVGDTPGVRGFFFKDLFHDSPRRAALLGPRLEEAVPLRILNYEKVESGTAPKAEFRRGDPATDGNYDLSDAVVVLYHLFLGGQPLLCADAADFDDNGALDISDPVAILQFCFMGGRGPAGPYPDCGPDPSADSLEACQAGC